MIAILYHVHMLPGKEALYQTHWKVVANYFRDHRGALGSTLHKNEGSLWVIHSKWPDEKTWKASWPKDGSIAETLPASVQASIKIMKSCVDKTQEIKPMVLHIKDSLG